MSLNPFRGIGGAFSHSFPSGGGLGAGIVVILLLAAVIGAIVLRVTFLSSRNQGKYTGFLGWLYDFLTFRVGILKGLLELIYLVMFFVIIALSLVTIFSGGVVAGLIALVVGEISLRLFYEAFLLLVNLCYTVMEMNRKLDRPTPPAPPAEAPTWGDPPPQS